MYRGIPQLFKDSSDKYYNCCGRLILKMRRLGLIPFDYIADNTRSRRKPLLVSHLDCATAPVNFRCAHHRERSRSSSSYENPKGASPAEKLTLICI